MDRSFLLAVYSQLYTFPHVIAEGDPTKATIGSKDAISNMVNPPEIHENKEPEKAAEIDPNWTPLGPDRFIEYKDGDNEFQLTTKISKESNKIARSRRVAVRNAMKHAWNGYKKHAWGYDEVKPQSGGSQNNWGGMGTTLVDSLDTLWLMDMKEEFWEARDWVRDHLNNDIPRKVSVFETTIRSLGGLLSAYDWSGDNAFLEKARDLGDRLFHAFKTSDGIPDGQVNLHDHSISTASWLAHKKVLAEVGTLQVEFRYLSKVTGNEEYATKSEAVFEKLKQIQREDGLYPYYLTHGNKNGIPGFGNNSIKFGANGDSFYEYMLKIWLQGGKQEDMYREMYDKAMDGVHDKLLFKTEEKGLTYIAELDGQKVHRKMDHLVCFLAGSLALGAYTHPEGVQSPKAQRDLKTGKALAYTCYQM